MDTPLAIETRELRKEFGDKVAVARLTLEVPRGEVFGFLGPNGAGKTTAVKMLLGLITPTSGHGQLLGSPLGDPRARARVGFLPEHFRFHEWLTAGEFMQLHADLYHMTAADIRTRIPELLDRVGLTPHLHKKLRHFSKGMLQRIGLAQALLNEPQVVILDEPTSGLDPGGRRMVRDVIRDLKKLGSTVFLNSHLLSEVEITCDRVAFIKHGEVVRVRNLQDLVDGAIQVQIRTGPREAVVEEGLKHWGQDIQKEADQLVMTIRDEADLPAIHRYLVEQGVAVYAFSPRHLSLEDLFIETVGAEGDL